MARRSIFISYARDDGPRVQKDAALLRAGGVRVFIDVQDIEAGAPWEAALESALEKCERVMVFWSQAAKRSTWVDREWRTALRLGKRVVPALLDDTALPPELAALQGIQRSPEPAGAALRASKTAALVWLATAVVAAALGWATLRGSADNPHALPSEAQPPTAAASVPQRSASDAAAAEAAVDRVRDQMLSLRLRIARAVDDEASASALREGREKLEATIHALPFQLMAVPDIDRLNAETGALRAAINARAAQWPESSAAGRELRLLGSFIGTSAVAAASAPPPAASGQDAGMFMEFSVLALIAMLITALPLAHLWRKRQRARKLVDAVFAT